MRNPMMISRAAVALVALLVAAPGLAAQQQDARGCQDHPLITRMPNYWIHHCPEKEFDAYAFTVGPNKKTETVEGQFWNLSYYPQATLKPVPSELQIQRNFENAITQQGGTLVHSERSRHTFKLDQGGQEIWIELTTEFTGKYGFTIVQKAGMTQDIVVDAAGLAKGLAAAGHMAVAGILFDTGESTIKAESAAAIAEVAKLLQGDPALKVFVVGHTDTVGSVESNLTLSQARAEAVVQALVRDHGVAAARLRAHGCGPFAPVATNDTDEGRARNRRVELVKQ